MEIKEKAKEYAKGKALEAISAAIEQAYADGYNEGLKHYENEKQESIVDGVEYKDLMLSSGTKWASAYLKDKNLVGMFPYLEACKFSLPSKEDFEELCRECAIDNYLYTYNKGIKFTGKNGEKLEIPYIEVKHVNDKDNVDNISFWLRSEGEGDKKEFAQVFSVRTFRVSNTFMGYKMPVLLVLKKDKYK